MAPLWVNMLIQIMQILLLCSGACSVCTWKLLNLEITVPGSLKALSESCLRIPCTFTPIPKSGESFDNTKPVIGVWMKSGHNFQSNPEYVIYNSSKPVNTYPMNITGDLREKNCTTMFYNLTTDYTNTYYFRIENGVFKASAICDPLQITVKDSPWTPSIQISGEQKEKEVLTITCSAVTPCPQSPPKLTWDKQDTVNVTETNSDGTLTTTVRLNLTLTDSHDGYNLTCSAAYPVTGGVKTSYNWTTLNVTYGPKNTSMSVSPSAPLSAGQLVKLSCSSRAKPPVNHFTWFRLTSQGPVNVSEGDTYSFNLTEDGVYHCVASNMIGNESSSLFQLKINDPSAALPWEAFLGAGIGLLIVMILVVSVWCFKSKSQAQRDTQRDTFEEADDETVHYGEIDFSKLNSKVDPDAELHGETVYSEVQVCDQGNRRTQPTEDLQEL